MRIGIDARIIDWAGVGRYTQNLLKSLREIDGKNEYILFCDQKSEHLVPTAPNYDKRVVEQPVLSPLYQFSWSRKLRRADLDVFHSPHFVWPYITPCPSVVTIHDLIPLISPEVMPSRLARIYYRWMNKRATSRAKRVIAVSKSTKQDLVRLLGVSEAKIKVIQEAVDERYKVVRDRELLKTIRGKYDIKQKFILNVGNPKPHKNWSRLIEAFFKLMLESRRNYQLVLVGPKYSEHSEIDHLIRRSGLEKRVTFTGIIGEEDLLLLYNAAEVFVFPSLYEGFGLPPLEAMACGIPVICSNTSSLSEVVGNAALMIDPYNVSEIAEAIGKVLTDNSLREKLRERGLARVNKFSWKKTAEATLKIYREVGK
ncbi:MAG: glycosyltransferase family 1 protein [Actinomycetota bacterium]|nr:glycosyltransferase family 1 protein [Actinomycetota bacterium]MDI6821820.1 glycosyltransferase family 1 protein [Actinomycetota bacterium]